MPDPNPIPTTQRFPLGSIVTTQGACNTVDATDIHIALRRHAAGDWGNLSPEDIAVNDRNLRRGGRLLSAYETESDQELWVITQADRTCTTVLLPEEY